MAMLTITSIVGMSIQRHPNQSTSIGCIDLLRCFCQVHISHSTSNFRSLRGHISNKKYYIHTDSGFIYFIIGPTQVKCGLLISSIFYATNFRHFLEMLEFNLWHFWKMSEIHYIKNAIKVVLLYPDISNFTF